MAGAGLAPFSEVRWGIVGCGNVTEVKSGPGLQQAADSQLVAVMRRDAKKAQDYASRHGVPKWYGDAAELIGDPEVNAVYVATPPDTHCAFTLQAAAAGKPVYVEKPMARTHAECLTMIGACAAAGVSLFVAYYRRRLPRFVRVKQLVDDGAIGAPRLATVVQTQPPRVEPTQALPWRLNPAVSGGGLLFDLGSHTLDVLDHILGPVAQVRGFAANLGDGSSAEDSVAGSFLFESGIIGTGTWCFSTGQTLDRNTITGTNGSVVFSSFGTEPVELITDAGSRSFAEPTPPHVQQPLIQTVVDQLCGRGECPSTGESAARTNRVLDQLLADYRGG